MPSAECFLTFLRQGLYNLHTKPAFEEDDTNSQWRIGQDRPEIPTSEKQQIAKFRSLLCDAIDKHLTPNSCIGMELSGGMDSSSIAASFRARYPHRKITAFTNTLPPEEIRPSGYSQHDESVYSDCMVNHFHLDQVKINNRFQFESIINRYAKTLGGYSEVLFPILNHRCYQLAEERGVNVLFSGFGGDEMVSQLATQYLNELRAQGKFFKYLYERNARKCLKWRLNRTLNPQDILTTRTIDDLSDLIHIPYHKAVEKRTSANFGAYPSVKAVAYDVLHGKYSGHLHARVNTSKLIAASHGIEMVFPLLDQDLLDYWYHLPSKLQRRHGQGRWLMRQAMKGILPEKVRKRQDKAGLTLPAATMVFEKELPEIFLKRIDESHKGSITEYVNIKKVLEIVKTPGKKSSAFKKLCLCILMLDVVENSPD